MNVLTPKNDPPRSAAIASGVSLLVMAAAAAYSYGFVHDRLVVPDDSAATAANLGTFSALFRTGILGWLLIIVCDVIAAWGLYRFFESVNRSLSLLSGWMRLAYTAILGIAVAFLALTLLSAEHMTPNDALAAESIWLSLRAFDFVWSVGLVIFGLHLWITGMLVFQAPTAPRWVGVLLQAAALSYLGVHLYKIAAPEMSLWFSTLKAVLSVPMALGELSLAFWLLLKGGRAAPQPSSIPSDSANAELKASESAS